MDCFEIRIRIRKSCFTAKVKSRMCPIQMRLFLFQAEDSSAVYCSTHINVLKSSYWQWIKLYFAYLNPYRSIYSIYIGFKWKIEKANHRWRKKRGKTTVQSLDIHLRNCYWTTFCAFITGFFFFFLAPRTYYAFHLICIINFVSKWAFIPSTWDMS